MTYSSATFNDRDARRIPWTPLLGFSNDTYDRLSPQSPFCTRYAAQTVGAEFIPTQFPTNLIIYKLPNDPPYIQAWKRIRAFTGLEPGWKGPDSQPVPQKAIDDAERFTLEIMATDTLAPDFVGAGADGELMITWRTEELFIDVGFQGNGTYALYAKIADQEILLDDVPVATKPDEIVLAALQTKKGQLQR